MLTLLYRPLEWDRAALVALAIALSVALYCLAYNLLAGVSESLLDGLVWAGVNVVPFYLAFELLKRATRAHERMLALAGAIAISLALQGAAHGLDAPGFELVRRLPAALLVLTLALLGPALALRLEQHARPASDPDALPLMPRQIDWIAAAGNYVELHGAGRIILHRASLASIEQRLAPHGFVRIHRGRLVARHAIARCRPNDIVLRDGTLLRTGARYRATLSAGL